VNYGVERVRTSNQEILDRLEHVEKLLDDDIATTLTRPPPPPPPGA
jgi:hypothetical protein